MKRTPDITVQQLSVEYVVIIPKAKGEAQAHTYYVSFAKHSPSNPKFLVTCTSPAGPEVNPKSTKSTKCSKAKAIKIAVAKHKLLSKTKAELAPSDVDDEDTSELDGPKEAFSGRVG